MKNFNIYYFETILNEGRFKASSVEEAKEIARKISDLWLLYRKTPKGVKELIWEYKDGNNL